MGWKCSVIIGCLLGVVSLLENRKAVISLQVAQNAVFRTIPPLAGGFPKINHNKLFSGLYKRRFLINLRVYLTNPVPGWVCTRKSTACLPCKYDHQRLNGNLTGPTYGKATPS